MELRRRMARDLGIARRAIEAYAKIAERRRRWANAERRIGEPVF
jgi:hypothetical protein